MQNSLFNNFTFSLTQPVGLKPFTDNHAFSNVRSSTDHANRRGIPKRTREMRKSFWNEAATQAGKTTQASFAVNVIEVFAFVSEFSPSLDEGRRGV
jgi:hypothetical protein